MAAIINWAILMPREMVIEATADGGRIILHGVANTQAAIDAALAAARALPGVSEAESAIQVVQEFTVMP